MNKTDAKTERKAVRSAKAGPEKKSAKKSKNNRSNDVKGKVKPVATAEDKPVTKTPPAPLRAAAKQTIGVSILEEQQQRITGLRKVIPPTMDIAALEQRHQKSSVGKSSS